MQQHETVTQSVTFAPNEVRMIRLWHWRKVLGYREFAEQPGNRARKDDMNRRANFHMRCVQALNDILPADSTAEGDEIDEQIRLKKLREKRNKDLEDVMARAAQ